MNRDLIIGVLYGWALVIILGYVAGSIAAAIVATCLWLAKK